MQCKIERPKRLRGKNGNQVADYAQQSVHRLAVVAYKVGVLRSSN